MNYVDELWIDMDGVIVDTLPYICEALAMYNIDIKDSINSKPILTDLDFSKFLTKDLIINDSIHNIKLLYKSKLFKRIGIETHVNSIKEGTDKINFLRSKKILGNLDIPIMIVPKEISKAMMFNPSRKILIDDYSGNLRSFHDADGISIKFAKEKEEDEFLIINNLLEIKDYVYEGIYKDNEGYVRGRRKVTR